MVDKRRGRNKLRRDDRHCPGSEKREQRGEFERDRDRILYTDALRRLASVTQVAGASEGHLFHNRLTHTLKYPWIRDTRHPDSKRYRKFGAYRADEDALKFARALGPSDERQSLEAAVMDYADDVAYSVHDLEDFFRAGLVPVALLAQGDDAFRRFLTRWCEDARSRIPREAVDDQRDVLLFMLRDLFPFDGQYDDTFEHRAALRTATSNLIQQYVWAARIAPPGATEPLEVPQPVRTQLKFLQRLVWTYVIDNPRLATQQHGQRRIIHSLFETYLTAVKARNVALVPPLFHRGLMALGEARPMKDRTQDTPEETRLAVDIVASLSDEQAVLLYRRLTGVATGSVTDYLSA